MTASHPYTGRVALLVPTLYLAASLSGYLYHAYWATEFSPALADFSPKALVVGYGLGIFFPVGAFLAFSCVAAGVLFVFRRLPWWFLLLPTLLQAGLVFYVFDAFRTG